MTNKITYIVSAPSFNPNNGGAIFQHALVDELNRIGERALLWPQPMHRKLPWRRRIKEVLKPQPYLTAPGHKAPIAQPDDLDPNSVVIYPEITLGNPLNAKKVVRWLLYPPGILHPFEFGRNEMFFVVDEMCDLPAITGGGAPELFLWKVNPTYRNENRPDRKGVCDIVRKGADKPRIPETETPEAIQLDGKSHEEIAEIFNLCETFYSYDEATMYSQYAAICGCLSVIIPGMHTSREDWAKQHELGRYGVAYGLNDLEHARSTRHKTLELLTDRETRGKETVKEFVRLTRERFGT